jgi:hypothetical protein
MSTRIKLGDGEVSFMSGVQEIELPVRQRGMSSGNILAVLPQSCNDP